jgi:hypothetical protein
LSVPPSDLQAKVDNKVSQKTAAGKKGSTNNLTQKKPTTPIEKNIP